MSSRVIANDAHESGKPHVSIMILVLLFDTFVCLFFGEARKLPPSAWWKGKPTKRFSQRNSPNMPRRAAQKSYIELRTATLTCLVCSQCNIGLLLLFAFSRAFSGF